ncbi:hypothetical protein [Vibrio astriarenae]|uniref:hypothetical protein n=1 Tax=Vibrio astriarenae TaxID=1481923 RepID=UPI00373527CE
MKALIKLGALLGFIVVAFTIAWIKSHNMSKDYFEHAQQMRAEGNYVIALKGMNKLELRRNDVYLGGYQQVIETWENTLFGPTPDFYAVAQKQASDILSHLTDEELLTFIEIYVELDMRYVPEAALVLLERAHKQSNTELALEMEEFLEEAFPRIYADHLAQDGLEYAQKSTMSEDEE